MADEHAAPALQPPPLLRLDGLAKSFGETPVFAGVSLALQRGEFVALLGESGVGKSTLLNCIAGLENADAGRVEVAGTDLATLDRSEEHTSELQSH